MDNRHMRTGIGAALGLLVLILDGKTALEGAQEGLKLCLGAVIPSLFPFFVLSILITGTYFGSPLPLLRPLGVVFSLPQGAEALLIPAFLGGYPVGAQCIAEAWYSKKMDLNHCQRILAFCSNAGPAFLFGVLGAIFPNKQYCWLLWMIHIASAWIVSALLPCSDGQMLPSQAKEETLTDAVSKAIFVMLHVCGWIILFRTILQFLTRWFFWLFPVSVQVIFAGLLELSNGCYALSRIEDISVRFVVCSGMLAWGGLCVAMQTQSVVHDLSLKYYYMGKVLQVTFSLFFSVAIVHGLWAVIPVIFLLVSSIRWKSRKNSSIFTVPGI